jgi:hypothetical protein
MINENVQQEPLGSYDCQSKLKKSLRVTSKA